MTRVAPEGFAGFRPGIPAWRRQRRHIAREIRRGLNDQYHGRLVFPGNHESQAASAFFLSPFQEAAVVTMDFVDQWATAQVGVGRGNRIEFLHELRFPHSLGLLEQRQMDLFWSSSKITEEVVLKTARHAWEQTGRLKNLVLTGGVALNCVANGRLLREGPFENLWIQPASGVVGGARCGALRLAPDPGQGAADCTRRRPICLTDRAPLPQSRSSLVAQSFAAQSTARNQGSVAGAGRPRGGRGTL